MISVQFMKNIAGMNQILNKFVPEAHMEVPAYTRKNLKFFSSSFCESCKEKLNLTADKFVKEK